MKTDEAVRKIIRETMKGLSKEELEEVLKLLKSKKKKLKAAS